jgi:hypothetical protein
MSSAVSVSGSCPRRCPSLEDLLLVRGGLAALGALGDDGAGVAHLLAGGRGEAGDVGDDRGVGDVLGDPAADLLLLGAADLADEDDRLGVGVLGEARDDVQEVDPMIGSPPMPTQVEMPIPARLSSCMIW